MQELRPEGAQEERHLQAEEALAPHVDTPIRLRLVHPLQLEEAQVRDPPALLLRVGDRERGPVPVDPAVGTLTATAATLEKVTSFPQSPVTRV